ncbi:hypothetical protein SAMN05216553_11692 [Lentzea fradiae]|uniref:DUF4352 domain-containing protein n=1 Tax=Lentzea fradiae TaxID=200378 RepID=A0A1G7ZU77_9PSEU|nr:hypothetical protein [Lentzea fradiae]SDH12259.1 hypothetical protein SAMN05216553_11692 [Lentzea fradiae]
MTHPPQHIQTRQPVETRKPSRFGSLAWTAVVLGLVGVACSWVILLNTYSAIVAVVGVVLGVVALFGTRKLVAVIGVVLCVAAVTVSVLTQRSAAEEPGTSADGATNGGEAAAGETLKKNSAVDTPSWGKRFSWTNGVAIDVAAPVACKPGRDATPATIARAVKFKVTVTNGTSAAFETALISLGDDAQFDGRKAEKIFDRTGECDSTVESTTVPPGEDYTFELAYAVGAQPGEMRLVFDPAFDADEAKFAGRA